MNSPLYRLIPNNIIAAILLVDVSLIANHNATIMNKTLNPNPNVTIPLVPVIGGSYISSLLDGLFVYVEANHLAYDSSCQGSVSFKLETIHHHQAVSPWWHVPTKHKENEQNFPSKPKKLLYNRLHKYSQAAPWCTYMLHHPETLPASAMSAAAKRFKYNHVINKELFDGIKLDPAREPLRKKLEERIDDMLQHTRSVVPRSLIIEQ